MKTMKTKMIALCLVLSSWTAFAQHAHTKSCGHKSESDMAQGNMIQGNMNEGNMAEFKDAKVEGSYRHYLHLKDALVASNLNEAKRAAGALQKSLADVQDGDMVSVEVNKVIAASNLDGQRKAFAGVSNMMAMVVKDGKLSAGMIYLDYCPMANATWLSSGKEINNPYYGAQMQHCGNVQEIIH